MAALTAEWFVAGFEPATKASASRQRRGARDHPAARQRRRELRRAALRLGGGRRSRDERDHALRRADRLLMTGLLVIASQFIGHTPLNLQLDPVLAVALGLALVVLWMTMSDGEMQPVEAVGLLAVYAILGATIWAEGALGT